MEHLDKLTHWINSRWRVYTLREAGYKKPWTTDVILQNYRFCNVHRENDRVTKWIRHNWPTGQYPEAGMLLCRIFNNEDTLQLAAHAWPDLTDVEQEIRWRKDEGERIFNPAYIVSTNGKKVDKINYVLGIVYECMRLEFNEQDCRSMSEALQTLEGVGTFMAGQVVADLKHTPSHALWTAPDKATFVVPGPGSIRGLEWLMGRRISRTTFYREFPNAYAAVMPKLDTMPVVDHQDFQNCLCEFDKYMRVLQNTGRPKQKFQGV